MWLSGGMHSLVLYLRNIFNTKTSKRNELSSKIKNKNSGKKQKKLHARDTQTLPINILKKKMLSLKP